MWLDVKNSTFFNGFRGLGLRAVRAFGLVMLACLIAAPFAIRSEVRAAPAEPFVSGEGFRVMCTSTWGHVAYLEMYAACRAYVAAVADMLADGQPVGNLRACFSEDTTKGRATEAVIAWMRAHPERKDLSAVQMTATALAQKYPCF